MNELKSADDIRELANAFRESRILLSAIELNIFSVIDKHLIPTEEISNKINTDLRATDRLLNALCAMGLLKKSKESFTTLIWLQNILLKINLILWEIFFIQIISGSYGVI